MNRLKAFLNGAGNLLDTLGGLPPGVMAAEVSVFVGAMFAVSQYHASDAQKTVVVGGVVALLAAGVAVERVVKAFKGK